MKRYILQSTTLTLLIFLVISCDSSKHIAYYYQDISKRTKEDSIREIEYYKMVSKKYKKKQDEILIQFSGRAFKGKIVTINDKDTLKFKLPKHSTECLGVRLYLIKKSQLNLKLETEGKAIIKFKIKENYDYIEVANDFNNKWGIVYSEYFSATICK